MAQEVQHADLKYTLLAIALWNSTFCTSGAVFGFSIIGIPAEVFLVSGGSMMSLGTAVVGPCVDAFGPRVTSVGGATLAGIGYFMLAYIVPGEVSVESYVSVALVTLGGIGPYLGSFSVASLFASPEIPIAAITGLFTLAGLGYETMNRAGLDRRTICLVYASLQFLGVVLCVLGAPSRPHLMGNPGKVLLGEVLGLERRHSSEADNGNNEVQPRAGRRASIDGPVNALLSRPAWLTMPSYWQSRRRRVQRRLSLRERAREFTRALSGLRLDSGDNLNSASFLAQATSMEYLGMVVWYSLNLTWILYFFTYVGPQVNNKMFCSLVPLIGNALPALLSFFVGTGIARFGWGISTSLTSLLAIAMILLSTLDNLILSYVALICFALSRALIFAVFFSYIPVTFGSENYGRLVGFATLVSGCFGFVNDALGRWSGFAASPDGVCSQGLVCTSRQACNRTNYLLAATLIPVVLYSVWLCKRRPPSSPPASPESPGSPCSASLSSPTLNGTPLTLPS